MHRHRLLFGTLSMACAAACAQAVLPTEFPPTSKPLPAPALKEAIAGKTFDVDLADGSHWRLEYKTNGYFFVNTSTGFNGTGEWHAEDDRLCARLRGSTMTCNEVRDVGGVPHLKRDSGEIIALKRR